MFSSNELKILKVAYEKHGFSDPYADVGIVLGKPDPVYHAACGLISDGLISMDRRGCVAIEDAGIRALHAAEEAAKKEAQEKAIESDKEAKADKRDRKAARRSWYQLLAVAFLTWLLSGICTPADVWRFIVGLFP